MIFISFDRFYTFFLNIRKIENLQQLVEIAVARISHLFDAPYQPITGNTPGPTGIENRKAGGDDAGCVPGIHGIRY